MATDLTTLITEPYCLPLNVRMIGRTVRDELREYADERLRYMEQYFARPKIKTMLRSRYPSDASLRVTTPEVSVPVQSPIYDGQTGNEEPWQEGVQKGLRVVVAITGIKNDQYVIEFTNDAGAYKITGMFALTQGTGDYDTDTTSTNTYLTIYKEAWIGTSHIKKGDKFYFTVNNYDKIITQIASLLTLGYAVKYDGLNIEQTYLEDGENLLKLLADVNSGVGLEGTVMHLDDAPIAMSGMDVDAFGNKFSNEPDQDAYGNDGEENWPHQFNRDNI